MHTGIDRFLLWGSVPFLVRTCYIYVFIIDIFYISAKYSDAEILLVICGLSINQYINKERSQVSKIKKHNVCPDPPNKYSVLLNVYILKVFILFSLINYN